MFSMSHTRRPTSTSSSSTSLALPARKTSHVFTYHPRSIRTPTSVIHLEYDPANVPPKPGPEWTRFVCISDTHARAFEVPDGDVLLHTGDLTNTGLVQEFRKTVNWLKGMRHRKKIIIAGNHDLTLHSGWYEQNFTRWHGFGGMGGMQDRNSIMQFLQGPEATAAGLVYLQDEEYSFQVKEGGRRWTVYGSPWSPEFFNWAFNYTSTEAASLISRISKTDILLTHGPMYQMHDLTYTGSVVGCPTLRKRIAHLRPRLHVAGHIHESRGGCVWAWPDRSPTSSSSTSTSTSSTFSSPSSSSSSSNSNSSSRASSVPSNTYPEAWEADGELVAGNTNILNYAKTNRAEMDVDDDGVENVEDEEGGKGKRKEQTVFINASNAPSGKYAWREDVKVPFGGPGFQAVIVDLKD